MIKALKIGQLAKMVGITVRTLHHYDDIGLLKPSCRSEAGHRLYATDDIRQLHTIVSLQSLKLSLEDIKNIVKDDANAFQHTLSRHLKCLESEIESKNILYERLKHLQYKLNANELIDIKDIVKNIEVMVMYEKYYTTEQLAELKQREANLSEEQKQDINKKWMDLFAAFQQAHQAELPINSPTVIALGQKANEYVEAFTGGDPKMTASFQNMYRAEGGSNVLSQHGVEISQAVFEYLAKAMGAAKKAQ